MEISTGGQLHFSDKVASATAVYRSDISIPWSYTTELGAELNCLHHQGILVMQTRISLGLKKDRYYRLMLSFEADGIWAITSFNSWTKVKSLTMDNDWHIYQVVVDNGTANVYMDEVWQCSFSMQERSNPDQVQQWCKGISTNAAEAHVDYLMAYVETLCERIILLCTKW